jgi:dihydrofolate reductase
MTNFVFIATSLDGFIAAADGGIDWLVDFPNPDKNDYGFAEFTQKIDALVMGRNTYEKVLTLNEWLYPMPVFVLSHSNPEIPAALKDKVTIIKGEPKEVVEVLNRRGYANLYIDGGKVIQSFLREDLIDELIITTVPILLGDGIPLFGKIPQMLNFQLIKTESYRSSLVKCHYARARE